MSLYTWFAQRKRPALEQRQLFDRLSATAQQADETLTAASGKARKHVIALGEMTEAEKRVGFLAKAVDADSYLAKVREAVAQEGREGSGAGARYSAFARYTRLAQETQAQIDGARQGLVEWRSLPGPCRCEFGAATGLPCGVRWHSLGRGDGDIAQRNDRAAFGSLFDRVC